MGISGISPWSLLLIFGIVVVLFGTKRLRTIAQDLGVAVKSFREGMNCDPSQPSKKESN